MELIIAGHVKIKLIKFLSLSGIVARSLRPTYIGLSAIRQTGV